MYAADIQKLLVDAETRRRKHLGDRVQDAFRIINGAGDGAPAGLTVDRYRDWLVLGAREQVADEVVEVWSAAVPAVLECSGFITKRLARRASESTSRVVIGEPPVAPVEVREADATFLCDLDGGLATGLYLDLHDVRLQTRHLAKSKGVLNLFAYTGSFSVHAALAGASRVTSVDVSKKALRRGRENMIASGLDPAKHRWFGDDVLQHLARATRRDDRYGFVVVDPPAFGRAKNRVFALEREFERLVDGVVPLVEADGTLLLSVHTESIDWPRMEDAVEAAAGARPIEVLSRGGLPTWDHPASDTALGDRGDYLRVLVVRLG